MRGSIHLENLEFLQPTERVEGLEYRPVEADSRETRGRGERWERVKCATQKSPVCVYDRASLAQVGIGRTRGEALLLGLGVGWKLVVDLSNGVCVWLTPTG